MCVGIIDETSPKAYYFFGGQMPKRRKRFKTKREPLFSSRQDALLVRRAVGEDWPVPMGKRGRIVEEVFAMIDFDKFDLRSMRRGIAAGQTLFEMDIKNHRS